MAEVGFRSSSWVDFASCEGKGASKSWQQSFSRECGPSSPREKLRVHGSSSRSCVGEKKWEEIEEMVRRLRSSEDEDCRRRVCSHEFSINSLAGSCSMMNSI
ncbi:hypothetical protein OIU77_002598 [Salix suchowensis]|uniref:Uncharacterized protein n=1 Tax=Salix suchowensis TaxID=1278906 RepID=A0ABQ9AXY9_9ROSI|nr:hypothetical protein OIU77_002598 [Salix suchowensis]